MVLPAYEPLDVDDDDDTKDLHLPHINSNGNIPTHHKPQAPSQTKCIQFGAVVLSLVSVVCAAVMYITTTRLEFPGERSGKGLRTPDQYNTLKLVDDLPHVGPIFWFPTSIVRANREEPDKIYTTGSHVVIDDNNSMFFQWHARKSKYTKCYVGAAIGPLPERLAINKTYVSSGPLASFQVWNVSVPVSSPGSTPSLHSVSWNTRPRRIGLLGTVAFLSEEEMKKDDDYEDGWQLREPTPRFECGERKWYTVEVTCEGCYLEFEQLLSLPPLAFDFFQIG